MSGSFYITTAIDYANGAPHLGHAYEKVLADVIARHARMSRRKVHFLTGLDEHGPEVQQTAQKRGISPQELVDEVAVGFRAMLRDLSISNDDYIRTTEPRHRKVVQDFLSRLHAEGLIFKDRKGGWYSVRQEQFLSDKDRDENGEWPEIFGEVTQTTEENYYFRISKFQSWLVEHIRSHPDFITPRFRQNQVLEFLKEPMNDLCISRPKSRLTWGIELPFDTDYVTYVWFDALTNYYSAVVGTGLWPADLHVIGKDILSPPHAVYWPCMLKALGLEPPRSLLVHGWWTIDRKKASKSEGNAKDSLSVVGIYGADAFRYYLCREMVVGQDADFVLEPPTHSENGKALSDKERKRYKTFARVYQTDLGNSLGNLVNRLLNMVGRSCGGVVPAAGADEDPERSVRLLWGDTRKAYDVAFAEHQVSRALESLWTFINALNAYIETRAPWKLAKSADPADRARLDSCLAHVSEGLRLVGTALLPVMPTTARTLLENIGQSVPADFDRFDWSAAGSGVRVAEKCILFPQVEAPPAPAA